MPEESRQVAVVAPGTRAPHRIPRYAAFISYSHASGRELARGLQKWLQSYAKPWYRWRAVTVFRDETDLAAAPALWSKIAGALDDSAYFILLASPEAAGSKWIIREIEHWLGRTQAGADAGDVGAAIAGARPDRAANLLIALIDGDIAWTDGDGQAAPDFDWRTTTALPRVLSGVFAEEPQWVDLRHVVRRDDLRRSLSRSNAPFMHAVAQLSAPIRGISDFSRLVSEDFRQHRRLIRTAWAAVAALLVLTAAAVWQWREAVAQRQQAQQQLRATQISQSRFLIDQSRRALQVPDPVTAALLALEALPARMDAADARPYLPEAESALFDALSAARELKHLTGHKGYVTSAAFSPDGTRVVSGSVDDTTRVWEVASGRELAAFGGMTADAVAFTADGRGVIEVGRGGRLRVWDVATARQPVAFGKAARSTRLVAFSRDARHAVTSNSATLATSVWDIATGTELLVLSRSRDEVTAASFSDDGTRLIAGWSSGIAEIWDVATGKQVAVLEGHGQRITSAAFAADGARAVTCSDDGTARIWNVAGRSTVSTLQGEQGRLAPCVLSPDSARVLTASIDATARVWEAASGRQLARLPGHEEPVTTASFTRDGTLAVTVSAKSTVRVWDLTSAIARAGRGRPAEALAIIHFSNWAAFSSDGSRLVTAARDHSIVIWDSTANRNQRVLQHPDAGVRAAAVSADGALVLTASGAIARLWKLASGRELKTWGLDGPRVVRAAFVAGGGVAIGFDGGRVQVWDRTGRIIVAERRGGWRDVAAISDDGRRLAEVTDGRTVRVWDLAGGAPIDLPALRDGERFAALSPDGSRVATICTDGTAQVLPVSSGEHPLLLRGHPGIVDSAAFSRDGRLVVTTSFDHTARVWESRTGREVAVLRGHEGNLTATFNNDGRRLVTASDDNTARVWSLPAGSPVVLRGHEQPVTSASFNRDGARVVTSSEDMTVRVWDAASGVPISLLRGHNGPVTSALFDADGSHVLSVASDGTARVWQVFPTTQALIDRARRDLPRQLSSEQRRQYFLE